MILALGFLDLAIFLDVLLDPSVAFFFPGESVLPWTLLVFVALLWSVWQLLEVVGDFGLCTMVGNRKNRENFLLLQNNIVHFT